MSEWVWTGSGVMRSLMETIDRVAMTDAMVLVWGESGVGKELVARRLHDVSLRRTQPFVKVNCAALPLELLESELFGYERGAFTGAHRRKLGKFEVANKGTLMLDEVGEMPLPLQAKMLHVLQAGEYSRLGSDHDIRVDVRVVAVTNKNLAMLVERGQFREDLYYRINVVSIFVPPLRQRQEEIPVLAEHFRKRYCEQYGRVRPPLSEETLRLFMAHSWKGNIRELENLVKRTVVLGSEDCVAEEVGVRSDRPAEPIVGSAGAPQAQSLPPSGNPYRGTDELGLKEIARQAAREAERLALQTVLERVRWNRVEAARRLKISYTALLYKMKYHALGRTGESVRVSSRETKEPDGPTGALRK